MKSWKMLFLSLFLVLGLTPVAGAQTLFRSVDKALALGEIDIETALLMKVSAATGKTLEYYEAYLPADGDARLPKSLTKLAIDIHNNWDSLSDYAQANLISFVQLPKLTGLTVYETEHFDIMYGDVLTPSNEFLEAYEDYLEISWQKEVEEAGFARPIESGRMIVLIGNTGIPAGAPDNAFIVGDVDISEFVYGFATWDTDGVPFLVLNNDYSAMTAGGSSDLADWAPAMQATAAHEFQHDTQFAEGWYGTAGDLWWAEASAVWCEDFVFDEADDYLQYVASQVGNLLYLNPWPKFPNISLLYFNGSHEYGNVLFAKYLSEVVDDDTILPEIWHVMGEYFATSAYPPSLAAIDEVVPGGLDGVFLGFVANNTVMNYEEGANYSAITILASFDYADFPLDDPEVPETIESKSFDGADIEVNALPSVLGANYIELVPEGGVSLMAKSSLTAAATDDDDDAAAADDDDDDAAADDDDDDDAEEEEVGDAITIAFVGDEITGGAWAVVVVGIADGEIATTDEMEIEDGEGEITIDDFNSGDYDTFYMIPAVLPRGDLEQVANNFEPAPSSDNLYEDYPQGNSYQFTVNLCSSSIDPNDSGCDCSIVGAPTADGFFSAMLIMFLPLIGLAVIRRKVRVQA
jgi:hypothetical protein